MSQIRNNGPLRVIIGSHDYEGSRKPRKEMLVSKTGNNDTTTLECPASMAKLHRST